MSRRIEAPKCNLTNDTHGKLHDYLATELLRTAESPEATRPLRETAVPGQGAGAKQAAAGQ